jgi:hypothetical protein
MRRSLQTLACLWLLLGFVPCTLASIDLTGSFTVYLQGTATGQTADFVQYGTSLTATAGASTLTGTIDPDSGTFTIVDYGFGCPIGIVGTARADGNAFSGDAITTRPAGTPHNPTCVTDTVTPLRGCRVGAPGDCCGDAVVGPSEQCDNGPEPSDACCDVACQTRPAGSACTEDGTVCTNDLCDASGMCTHPAAPSGVACVADGDPCTSDVCDAAGACQHPVTADSDGDGLCDLVDPCTGPAAFAKPSARLRGFVTPGQGDRLLVRGTIELPAAPNPPLDPATKGLRLVLASADRSVFTDVVVPPGAGWTTNAAGTTFKFRAGAGTFALVDKVSLALRSSRPGQVKVMIAGSHGAFPLAPLTLPLIVTVVLDSPQAATGECGEVVFAGPPPLPACQIVASDKLRCR